VVERFIRSMKTECTRQIRVPLDLRSTRDEIGAYAQWHDDHRPHQALHGLARAEMHPDAVPRDRTAGFEPRPRWPAPARGDITRVRSLRLTVKHFDGRAHLPVVELAHAA